MTVSAPRCSGPHAASCLLVPAPRQRTFMSSDFLCTVPAGLFPVPAQNLLAGVPRHTGGSLWVFSENQPSSPRSRRGTTANSLVLVHPARRSGRLALARAGIWGRLGSLRDKPALSLCLPGRFSSFSRPPCPPTGPVAQPSGRHPGQARADRPCANVAGPRHPLALGHRHHPASHQMGARLAVPDPQRPALLGEQRAGWGRMKGRAGGQGI